MNDKSRKTLEFEKILEQIAKFAFSKGAKDIIMALKPMQNKLKIERQLNEVEEAFKILYEHSLSPFFNVDDITQALEKAAIMSVLSMGELLKISKMLRTSRNLQSLISKVNDETIVILKDIVSKIYIDKGLEESIDKAIISETEMSDHASGALRNIRNKIRKIGENIKARLHNYISSPSYSKILQDNIVTIRNGRYVIPLKAEHRGAIPGLVHDQSSSGSTIYLEPMAVVEMNNDLKTAMIEEDKEIERILREFTVEISNNVDEIKISFEIITYLDAVFAKAMYAESQKAVKPKINEDGYINISKARHPLIKKEDVVANTIYLGKDFRMLFIRASASSNVRFGTSSSLISNLCKFFSIQFFWPSVAILTVPVSSASFGLPLCTGGFASDHFLVRRNSLSREYSSLVGQKPYSTFSTSTHNKGKEYRYKPMPHCAAARLKADAIPPLIGSSSGHSAQSHFLTQCTELSGSWNLTAMHTVTDLGLTLCRTSLRHPKGVRTLFSLSRMAHFFI